MNDTEKRLQILIAGAGSIGFFIGGLLHQANHKVTFLARERMVEKIKTYGLRLTDYRGLDIKIDQNDLNLETNPKCLAQADIILVTVKSAATKEMAQLIGKYAKNGTTVISLQNGISNRATLKKNLATAFETLAGMVPFNVAQMENARFHQGTSGNIVIETSSQKLAKDLSSEHLVFEESKEIENIQSGKLLINLNNALNALSGLPLLEQLTNRGWRRIMADQMREAHTIMRTARMKPKPPSPVPASVIPYILKLPTPLFKIIAKKMLDIDPLARSSMWEDLEQGRKTEIDELQGTIIKLAHHHDMSAPMNERVISKIKDAENQGEGSPHLEPHDI